MSDHVDEAMREMIDGRDAKIKALVAALKEARPFVDSPAVLKRVRAALKAAGVKSLAAPDMPPGADGSHQSGR